LTIPIYNNITGSVFLRHFDRGVLMTMGAVPNPTNREDPCWTLTVSGFFPDGSSKSIPVFMSHPEAIFQKMIYPFISVNRDDVALSMHRWMGVGQLEYKVGVSGTQTVVNGVSGYMESQFKFQAFPHDITYTISIWDRYEAPTQTILLNVLNSLYPVGKLIVYDSLGLRRTYEYYWEGSIANLQEMIDPVTAVRGYALTLRVEGELDIANIPTGLGSVSGINLDIEVNQNLYDF